MTLDNNNNGICYLIIDQIRITKNSSPSNVWKISDHTDLIHPSNRSQITRTKMTSSGAVYRCGSLKNFKIPTTEGVRRILSREEVH